MGNIVLNSMAACGVATEVSTFSLAINLIQKIKSMKVIKRYGQLVIILSLALIIFFLSTGKKIDEGALIGSIYVDEKLKESNFQMKNYNSVLHLELISNLTNDSIKSNINRINILTDTMYNQIVKLKELSVKMSGGMRIEGNIYTLNNPGRNSGHSNILTGDKDKDNGEGSKLKRNINQLRTLLTHSLTDKDLKEIEVIKALLNTSDRQENGSDYMFSWEEQYFKLLTTVGILNLLSVLEYNILLSEQIFLQNQILKQKNSHISDKQL